MGNTSLTLPLPLPLPLGTEAAVNDSLILCGWFRVTNGGEGARRGIQHAPVLTLPHLDVWGSTRNLLWGGGRGGFWGHPMQG